MMNPKLTDKENMTNGRELISRWIVSILLIAIVALYSSKIESSGLLPTLGGGLGAYSSSDELASRKITFLATTEDGSTYDIHFDDTKFYKAHGLTEQDISSMKANPKNQDLRVMLSYILKSDYRILEDKLYLLKSHKVKNRKRVYRETADLSAAKKINIRGVQANFRRLVLDSVANTFRWEDYYPPLAIGGSDK